MIYTIYGDDTYSINKEVASIINKYDNPDIEEIIVDEKNIEDLFISSNTSSFFSSHKIIKVITTKIYTLKNDIKNIEFINWLKKDNLNDVIFIFNEQIDTRYKVSKSLMAYTKTKEYLLSDAAYYFALLIAPLLLLLLLVMHTI